MLIKKIVSFSLFFALFIFSSKRTLADESKTITMSVFVTTDESIRARFQTLLYDEALGRLGYKFKFKYLPALRGSDEANKGLTDGEPGRRWEHNEKYTNLVRVEESYDSVTFIAFAARSDIKIKGLESLKDTNYRVDYQRGVVIIKEKISAYLKPQNILALDTREQALNHLLKGRADLYINDEFDMQPLLNSDQYRQVIYKAGVLFKVPVYGFLNKKHKDLAQRLAKVIRDMKDEQLTDKMRQQVLGN
jgi:polar amino acid transport system substrate-binding protein